ncbi:hypothetical protein V502_10584 [Pseudogymnoascus sp. VKM F-4520 (FW-2644)]|nr:hypothetical protein V502_10584 [Pseudogymnoascus sp. VKM F-4520 (FW-2644)]
MSSQRLATYFVPATGIDREVITTDICRYLGNDALVKPGQHKVTHPAADGFINHTDSSQNSKGEPISGYFITAYRALTTDQLTDIKADSARWGAERAKNQTNRGSQGGGISPLRDSDVGVRSSNITPEVGYRSSLTRARQQQPPWDDAAPLQGGYSIPSPQQQPNQAGGRYDGYPSQPQQPPQPYGAQPEYNPNPNYSYGTPVQYGLSQAPSQPPRTGFAPPNPQYGDGRGMNQGYQPDNRAPPQGYYDQPPPMPQGRGQPAIPPQQQYQQRDSLPGQDPYNYNGGRGPQEDQDMEYDYEGDFADPQGQPPKPTSSGQSRHRSERSDREPDRRTDRHPGKHRR